MTKRKLIAFAVSLLLTLCGIAVAQQQGIGWHFDMMRAGTVSSATQRELIYVYQGFDTGWVYKYAASNMTLLSSNRTVGASPVYALGVYGDNVYVGNDNSNRLELFTGNLQVSTVYSPALTGIRGGILADSDFVYGGNNPLYKMNAGTLAIETNVVENFTGICGDGSFTYISGLSVIPKIRKSDLGLITNVTVAGPRPAGGGTIAYANGFVYEIRGGIVRKVDPTTMTILATNDRPSTTASICANDTEVFVSTFGYIYKYDAGTLAFISSNDVSWGTTINNLACDASNVYACGTANVPIKKYRISDMVAVATGRTVNSFSRQVKMGW